MFVMLDEMEQRKRQDQIIFLTELVLVVVLCPFTSSSAHYLVSQSDQEHLPSQSELLTQASNLGSVVGMGNKASRLPDHHKGKLEQFVVCTAVVGFLLQSSATTVGLFSRLE